VHRNNSDQQILCASQSILPDNTKIRIVGFLDPAALIVLREYYKHLVMVILLDNGSSEVGANAATASIADCENVDGVLHGFKGDGRKVNGSGGLKIFVAPAHHFGSDVVA